MQQLKVTVVTKACKCKRGLLVGACMAECQPLHGAVDMLSDGHTRQ